MTNATMRLWLALFLATSLFTALRVPVGQAIHQFINRSVAMKGVAAPR
jgi:hypothetical protein